MMIKRLVFKRVWVLIFAFILTGCATNQEYSKPTGGPVAELKLVNVWGKSMYDQHMRWRGVEPRDQRELQLTIYENKCMAPATLSVTKPTFIKNTTVPASKRLYLMARGYLHTYRSSMTGWAFHGNDVQCVVPISFDPEPGARYELEYSQSGPKCIATISKWMSEGATRTLIKDRTMRREKLCKEKE